MYLFCTAQVFAHTHTHTLLHHYLHVQPYRIYFWHLGRPKNANYFKYTSLFFSFQAWRKNELQKFSTNYYINKFSFKNKHTKNKESWRLGGFWLLQPSRHAHSLHVHHRWFGLGSFMAQCNFEFDVGFWLVRNPLETKMHPRNRGNLGGKLVALPSLKLTWHRVIAPEKVMGLEDNFPFGMVYFQGRTVKLPGVTIWKNDLLGTITYPLPKVLCGCCSFSRLVRYVGSTKGRHFCCLKRKIY